MRVTPSIAAFQTGNGITLVAADLDAEDWEPKPKPVKEPMPAKERRLAPALYLADDCSFPEFRLSDELYESAEQAYYELGECLLKWLGGTPYEVALSLSDDAIKEIGRRVGMKCVPEDTGRSTRKSFEAEVWAAPDGKLYPGAPVDWPGEQYGWRKIRVREVT